MLRTIDNDLTIIYCHLFTDIGHRSSIPVGICREANLLRALGEAEAGVRSRGDSEAGSHLLEPVAYTELSEPDRRELAKYLLRVDMLFHQLAWGDICDGEETLAA